MTIINNKMIDDELVEEGYPVVADADVELGNNNIVTTTTATGDNDNGNGNGNGYNDDDDDDDDELAVTDGDDDDDNEEDNNKSNNNKYGCIKKIIVGLILLGFIIFVIIDSLTNKYVQTTILQFLNWVEDNPILGVLAFMLVYLIATVFFIPGSILTLGAGFVFSASTNSLWTGVLLGTIAVFIGASFGAILSFLLGRYLFRDGFITKLTKKYTVFKAIDNALEEKGLRIMILLRLSPIIPFNVLNYVSGVTGIKFLDYCIACIGMLPGTILYVFLGSSAGSLSEIGGNDETEADADADAETEEIESNDKTVTIIVIVVGVVFGILAVGLTSYYAKQELNKVIAKKEAEELEQQAELDELEQTEAEEQVESESGQAVVANEATSDAATVAPATTIHPSHNHRGRPSEEMINNDE
jgi:uncharacterized membrane protein YdjX (TVP38/TMEM64 family)